MDLLIKEANWANNSLEGNNSLVYEFQTLGGPPRGTGVPDFKGHVWPNAFSSVEPTSTAFPHRNARHCLMFKANSDTQDGFGPVAVMMRNVFEKVAFYVRGQSPYYNHMDTVRVFPLALLARVFGMCVRALPLRCMHASMHMMYLCGASAISPTEPTYTVPTPIITRRPSFSSQYFSGVDQYFVAGVETLWEQGFMPLGMKVDKHYYLNRLSKVRAKYNFFGRMTNVRQVQLPPVTNDAEQPWKAVALALGSVLATVLLGAAVFWVVRCASGNAGGVEVATHQL